MVFVTKRQTFFVAKRFMMFSKSSSRASGHSVESKPSHLSRNVVRLADSPLISSRSHRQSWGNVQQEAEWCDRPNQFFGLQGGKIVLEDYVKENIEIKVL